jgi:hypothetical protein
VSGSFQLTSDSKLELGWGRYSQFPDIDMIELSAVETPLSAERSTHYVAALEHQLDAQTRIRIEAYDRQDHDVLDAPDAYPRLEGGQVIWPASVPLWKNAYDGYSRGVQLMLQRRSANRLSGWIGYTLGYNREWDRASQAWFDSDNDVRHALTLYAAYRVTPSINVSTRFNYGSGAPVPGYFQVTDFAVLDSQTIVAHRNTSRLPAYERWDLRLNKSFVHPRWKMTVYGELLNTLNHRNLRYLGIVGDYRTVGFANLASSLSRVPAVGVSIEF